MLVGSVAGQRYWSTLLPVESQSITSGTWTPDDQQVYLGTAQVRRKLRQPTDRMHPPHCDAAVLYYIVYMQMAMKAIFLNALNSLSRVASW